jgi:hypothetical protein
VAPSSTAFEDLVATAISSPRAASLHEFSAAYAKSMAAKDFESILVEYRRIGGPQGHTLLINFAKRGTYKRMLVEGILLKRTEHRGSKDQGSNNSVRTLKKKTRMKRGSRKRLIRLGSSRVTDRTMIPKKKSETLTPEQEQARARSNRQGFHEGAHVPGYNLHKIGK